MNQPNNQNIEIWERINREDVQANREKIFLFGDNLTERGFGGQAKEMRGEENSRGIPTKKAPNNNQASFFTDKEFASNKNAIDEAFGKIPSNKTLVIPKAGIGTGLARLSQTAPQTFTYLNKKFAEIGFDNTRGKAISNSIDQSNLNTDKLEVLNESKENEIVIRGKTSKALNQKRLLDLDNILTENLQILSPSEKEVEALNIDRRTALTNYADKLREDYRADKSDFRDGMKLLSDSIDKGDQITITCPCHNGEMCHADVVKMAIEKVNFHLKNKEIHETDKLSQGKKQTSPIQKTTINPRTQRAINEMLAFSKNDLLLERINHTTGRNRAEQASYLGKQSQFVRDIYEHGATVKDGKLIVPQERLKTSNPLFITTQEYAVKRISKLLGDENGAKEIAPNLVEYADKISGKTADGETRLKVFNWIYESLEGKSDFLEKDDDKNLSKNEKFENTLENIRFLAEEMGQLEPTDKLEFAPLKLFELSNKNESVFDQEANLDLETIYEMAINREENDSHESSTKISTEKFERIELNSGVPKIPEEFTEIEIKYLLSETLPDIDRKLEEGISRKEILEPFNEMVWQSAKDDTLNQLEKIYQKQKINEIEERLFNVLVSNKEEQALQIEKLQLEAAIQTPTQEAIRELLLESREKNETKTSPKPRTISQLSKSAGELSSNIKDQLGKIDLHRQNVIELKTPDEYIIADKEAINAFFRVKKLETGNLLEKLDKTQKADDQNDKTKENVVKKELNKLENSKPTFAYKLENSSEIVAGEFSSHLTKKRNFVSSYIDYQLKQPEIRLRHSSERFRNYAKQLENVVNRDELKKTASEIRIENAKTGFKWKDLDRSEKATHSRPLSQKEMQFLFTENSPKHYTSEMTALKLSYAHSGNSRRQLTKSLINGEITPSPEAQKLQKSLESRLERRELTNAVKATKHFFHSLKTDNSSLKYKNEFDHREIYRTLPPQEKDFIYAQATQQKENLEYRIAYKQKQQTRSNQINRDLDQKQTPSKTEKSFYLHSQFNQARILGENLKSSAFFQKEISERDTTAIAILLNNHSSEKIDSVAQEFRVSKNLEDNKIGEVLKIFNQAEISKVEDKTIVSIQLPENSIVEIDTYQELLENFYPDEDLDKYKFANFNEKSISNAREKGQDASLNTLRDATQSNIYQKNASANVFTTEQSIIENFDNIKQLQETARTAKRENENILEKYSRRAATKLKDQNQELPSLDKKKDMVSRALDAKGDAPSTNILNNKFFETIKKEITITDFQKFAANEKLMDESKVQIKHEFTEISHQRDTLQENIFKASNVQDKNESLQQTYNQIQQLEENRLLTISARKAIVIGAEIDGKTIIDLVETSEVDRIKEESAKLARIALEPNINSYETKDKPVSLQLFENEISRAEKELLSNSLSGKILESSDFLDRGKLPNLETIFSPQEREQIKLQAIETAKDRLEPKELDADHRKLSNEASGQALTTFKQLEQATNIFQTSVDKSKINESFSKLDHEAIKLNQIRQDYDRAEKLLILQVGIKTDIAELLKKEPELKNDEFLAQTNQVIARNIDKIGLLSLENKEEISSLSKEIAFKIETKRDFGYQEHLQQYQIENTQDSSKKNTNIKSASDNYEKTKTPFVLHR